MAPDSVDKNRLAAKIERSETLLKRLKVITKLLF